MKRFLLLSTLFLFVLLNRATAQLTPIQAHKQALQQREQAKGPQVSKGYYSVGDNAQKLYRSTRKASPESEKISKRAVRKGFYTIADNYQKVSSPVETVETTKNNRNVQKGFYSIGSNAAKL